ncbi:cell division cycle and apoptosis regulator protein 1 [Pelomyxa schiedti]|nr:cell division cycle and apoptosis regulator protein 1 [Pelomyxa schiedti]
MPITSYNPPGGLLAHSTPNPSQPSRFSSFNDIATATRHAQDFLSSKAAQFSHMQTNPSSGVRTADYAGVKRDDSWPIRRSTTSSITSSSPSSSRSSAPSPPPPRRSAAPPPARHTPSRRRSSRSRSRSRTRSRTRSRSRSRVRPHSKSRSRSHSPRRSSPGPKLKKEVVPPKRRDASIERDKDRKYSFKMPPYVLNKPVYTLLDLKTMFTSLYLVSDFTSLHANWVDTAHVDLLALDKAITFEIENVDVEEPPQLPPGTVHSGFIYNAKVFLMSGISYSTLAKPRKEGEFFGKMLHFLVGNKENSLMAFGGPWVAELDGGDPTQDDTLKQTAIRTVHETIGVDLSKCTQWLRFMEVRYSRSTCFSPDSGEITVIFLPSIIDIAQPEAVLKKEKPESDKKEVENLASVDPLLTSLDKPEVADHKSGASLDAKSNTTAPSSPAASSNSITTPPTSVATSSSASKDPVIVVKNKRPKHAKGTRTMCISLEGLLEYNESDVQECTFEVSLFGELFSMMLGRDFGALILEHMLKYSLTLPLPSDKEKSESKDKKSPVSVPDSSKRKRDTEMHPTEPPGKKPRVEGENGNTKPDTTDQVKKLKNDDVNTQENGTAHTTKEVDSGQLQTGEQATGVTNNQLTVPSSNKDTDLGPLSKEKPKPKGLEPVKKSDTSVEQKAPLKQEGKSDILSKNVNRELVRAFQYFDRSSVGFLRPYDIEAMIHCLGYQMSKRDVQTLVSRVVDHHYTHHQLLLQNIVSNQSASINITLPSQQQSVMRVPEWCRHKLYYIKFAEVVGSSHISNSQSSQVNAVPSPEHPVHSSMNLNQGPLVTQNNPPTHDNSVTGMPCESDVTMDSNKAAESTDTSSTEQSTTGQQEFQNNNTTASETTAATTSEQVSAESNVLLIEEAAEVPTEGGVQYQDQEQYADQQQYQEQQDPEQQQQLMSSDAQQVQEQGDQDGYTEEQTYQPVDTDQQAGDQDGTIEHYEDLVDGGGTTEEAPSENQDKGPDVGAE